MYISIYTYTIFFPEISLIDQSIRVEYVYINIWSGQETNPERKKTYTIFFPSSLIMIPFPELFFDALLTDCMPVNSESLAVADLAFPGA